MNGEDNRKGPGFFYGVIGVATLVVAIIGATFAYFTATANNTTTIQGEAANTGLSLEVTQLSTGATAGLIPLNETDLQKGITGDTAATAENKSCLDKNNNTICQVYSIKVTNEGTATAAITGKLNLQPVTGETTSTFTNLKWQLLEDATTVATDATSYGTGENNIATNLSLTAGNSETLYIVIWIDNLNESQNEADKGYFNGTVSFDSAEGAGISATFSA